MVEVGGGVLHRNTFDTGQTQSRRSRSLVQWGHIRVLWSYFRDEGDTWTGTIRESGERIVTGSRSGVLETCMTREMDLIED